MLHSIQVLKRTLCALAPVMLAHPASALAVFDSSVEVELSIQSATSSGGQPVEIDVTDLDAFAPAELPSFALSAAGGASSENSPVEAGDPYLKAFALTYDTGADSGETAEVIIAYDVALSAFATVDDAAKEAAVSTASATIIFDLTAIGGTVERRPFGIEAASGGEESDSFAFAGTFGPVTLTDGGGPFIIDIDALAYGQADSELAPMPAVPLPGAGLLLLTALGIAGWRAGSPRA